MDRTHVRALDGLPYSIGTYMRASYISRFSAHHRGRTRDTDRSKTTYRSIIGESSQQQRISTRASDSDDFGKHILLQIFCFLLLFMENLWRFAIGRAKCSCADLSIMYMYVLNFWTRAILELFWSFLGLNHSSCIIPLLHSIIIIMARCPRNGCLKKKITFLNLEIIKNYSYNLHLYLDPVVWVLALGVVFVQLAPAFFAEVLVALLASTGGCLLAAFIT